MQPINDLSPTSEMPAEEEESPLPLNMQSSSAFKKKFALNIQNVENEKDEEETPREKQMAQLRQPVKSNTNPDRLAKGI